MKLTPAFTERHNQPISSKKNTSRESPLVFAPFESEKKDFTVKNTPHGEPLPLVIPPPDNKGRGLEDMGWYRLGTTKIVSSFERWTHSDVGDC